MDLIIEVFWNNRSIQFPYRVYIEITKSEILTCNDPNQLGLFTRHHNGYLREIAIEQMMHKFPTESIPFLAQLIAEYVLEIAIMIQENINEEQRHFLQKFLIENPKHAQTLKSKIASYWDCYYKRKYLILKDYPAYQILNN